MKNNQLNKRDSLNAQIAAIQDIENIINEYNAAQAKYDDAKLMYDQTRSLNENVTMFFENLEDNLPKEIIVSNMSTSDEGVQIAASSKSYDAIAKLIIQLKTIPCIDDAFVTDINESDAEGDEITYEFNVTAKFVSMVEEQSIGVEEEDTSALQETTEATAE